MPRNKTQGTSDSTTAQTRKGKTLKPRGNRHRNTTPPGRRSPLVATVQQQLYSSVHADYFFALGRDEPIGSGDGRPHPIPYSPEPAERPDLSGRSRPGAGTDAVKCVEPPHLPTGLRNCGRRTAGAEDPLRDRQRPSCPGAELTAGYHSGCRRECPMY